MPDSIYDTATYFKNSYQGRWTTNEFSVEMIEDVDKSEVISANAIESPVLGTISPLLLSGRVKTLLLVKFDKLMFLTLKPAEIIAENGFYELQRIAKS